MTVLNEYELRNRRLKFCVDSWPECASGDYNPKCCRFPKSCSPHGYIEAVIAGTLTDADLEPSFEMRMEEHAKLKRIEARGLAEFAAIQQQETQMTQNIFNSAKKDSLSHAKDEVLGILETEKVRHDSELSVLTAKYESTVSLENEFHKLRVAELEGLITRINDRIPE